MNSARLRGLLQIKNSFLLVLLLIQVLIVALATLLTRLAIHNIEEDEAAKRTAVTTFATAAFDHGTAQVEPAIAALVANPSVASAWVSGNRAGLLAATHPLFDQLSARFGVKQMQFTGADFKVFLRTHNPPIFGDDVTTSRPTLVECITNHHSVAGLEQGRSGYGFRAVAPDFLNGAFLGCAELGLDLGPSFLTTLDANYNGRWAIINLDKSTSLTRNLTVLATLHEPADSAIVRSDYILPENIAHILRQGQPYFEYLRSSEEVALYVPIRNFRGDIALCVRYVSPTPYYATVRRMVINALVIAVLGMVLTGLAFGLLYRGIRTPVHQLVVETEKIKNLDLSEAVEIKASLVDLERLIRAVAEMKAGLQSFQKYVPADLVRVLIETGQQARIGGKLKELTVFFSDIANFTTIAEDMAPNELTRQLSEYFDSVTEIILRHQGTVDKYIGDAVMAFWGAPLDVENHALLACQGALRCRREIERLSAAWKAEGRYEFHTRIGLATGEIVVGNIGSEQRLNYSVIGDTVNLASRLEGLNKQYGTSIIISETTWQLAGQGIEARLIDFVTVKGKLEPVRIYELIGERGDISPRQKESLKLFSRAIEAYMGRDFENAIRLFTELQTRDSGDAVTKLYLDRCREYLAAPPEPGWLGAYHHTTK